MSTSVKTPTNFEMTILSTNGKEIRITAEMIKDTLHKLANQKTKQQKPAPALDAA